MSDTPSETPYTFPEFDAAAVRAEITNYNPATVPREAAPTRAMSSGRAMAPALSMLAPEDRGNIPQRLAAIADPERRAAVEAQLVGAVMQTKANAANIRRGHPNGSLHDQAVAEVTNRVWDLESEAGRIGEELDAVARYETVIDPVTGQPSPKPIYAVSGTARARLEARQQQIAGNILTLEGPEGQAALNRAADAELAIRQARHEDARVLFEAERRARQIVSEERIEALAQAKAKSLRGMI